MLSRSGLSLRRLVVKRRNTSDDEDGFGFDNYVDASSLKAASKRQQRGGFWSSGKQTATKKTKKNIPKPIVVIRQPDSVHRISSPLPSLPETAQSSASSLCSCDCHHSHITPSLLSGKRSPGLCSVTESKRSYESSMPPTPRLGERVQQKFIDTPLRGRNVMHIRSASPEPTFNLLEALALSPEGEDEEVFDGRETPRPAVKEQRAPLVELSDNVQQLIRETDEAFKAVGSALAEARLAAITPTQDDYEQAGCTQTPQSRPTTPSRTILKKPPRIIISPHKSPTRASSVSKTTRKKARRQRSKSRITTKPNSSRWTLTDNVSEMFNGRLFNRIEADEMLTPNQLYQMRQHRMAQLKPKRSTETIRTVVSPETDGSETPINPFHLEDLPSRIGNSGVRLTVPSPMAEKPPPRLFDFEQVVRRDFSSPALRGDKTRQKDQTAEDSNESMTISDVSFPSPPVKNPMRFVPRRQLPPLPTIPELTATAPGGKSSSRPRTTAVKPLPTSDEYVFLRSTPFTLTMPTYRHGPIRLARNDVAQEPHARADETTLDWTAFQMAILGGAGDFFSGTTDYIRQEWWREDDDFSFDDAADVGDWFDSFGFEHAGMLISAEAPPPLSTPSLSSVTTAATIAEDQQPYSPVSPTENLPIPVDSEFPSGFWNDSNNSYHNNMNKAPVSPSTLRSRRKKFAAGGELGLRRWTGEGHPKRYVSRASVDSLPQSPMLDLVMSEGADEGRDSDGDGGGGVFTVPMGYNLGHDLGDFLRWEAEYVSASGLCGSE